MATRIASRLISRRFSSGGKVLGEEEKAAENVFIKKMEQEKLEKLARKGPQETASATASSTGANAEAKPFGETPNVSTDKHKNYAIVAGIATLAAAAGWYLRSNTKKPEEVQD